jgi:hypothetical protein
MMPEVNKQPVSRVDINDDSLENDDHDDDDNDDVCCYDILHIHVSGHNRDIGLCIDNEALKAQVGFYNELVMYYMISSNLQITMRIYVS